MPMIHVRQFYGLFVNVKYAQCTVFYDFVMNRDELSHRCIRGGGQGGTCPPWDFLRVPSGPGFEVAGSNDPPKVSHFCKTGG